MAGCRAFDTMKNFYAIAWIGFISFITYSYVSMTYSPEQQQQVVQRIGAVVHFFGFPLPLVSTS